jgi:hypothetical protein
MGTVALQPSTVAPRNGNPPRSFAYHYKPLVVILSALTPLQVMTIRTYMNIIDARHDYTLEPIKKPN